MFRVACNPANALTVQRDEIHAGLLDGWYKKRVAEFWPLVAQREAYKNQWFEINGSNIGRKEALDFVLRVPNALLPAILHGAMKE